MTVVTQRYTFSGTGEDFGPRKGRFLVILHTFENTDPAKNTMRDAVAGATWQDRNDILGSYNRLIAVDGVLGCVPDDRASGGVNPASPYFKPLPWLSEMLPAYVVSDPNAYALQLCAMGRRDYYDANGWPPSIIDGFARSILEEEAASGNDMVVANHASFQPGNRSDAGDIALDLVMKRYQELTATPEDDMQFWRPVQEDWFTSNGTVFYDGDGNKKLFTDRVPVRSFAESGDGRYRLIRYGDSEVLVVDARTNAKEGPGLQPVPGSRVPATGYGFPPSETSELEGKITEQTNVIAGLKTDLATANAKIAAVKAAVA